MWSESLSLFLCNMFCERMRLAEQINQNCADNNKDKGSSRIQDQIHVMNQNPLLNLIGFSLEITVLELC